jgi:serine/threonine protein kinase
VVHNDLIFDVAAAVSDGVGVDWVSAEQSATSEEDRRLLGELRFIAEIGAIGAGVRSPRDTATARGPSEPPEQWIPLATTSRRTEPGPNQWGPLRIIERVGRGTFGDVYRAWDMRLDRQVALKILHRKEPGDALGASTAIAEGRLLARVRHPNVVTVYGADKVGEQVGIWMEFVRGKTLEQELGERGPFDINQVVSIGIELSGALAAVHRAGLLHRDIKTHNVLRDPDGRLILTDLGAGCELEDMAEGPVRELAGTPLYVAPEVLAGQAATPQSDIYSLGVLLYHVVTGGYPVGGRSLNEVREAHGEGTRTTLREARPDLPMALVEIVERALDPDPQKRYERPDALAAALSGVVHRGGAAGARFAAGARRARPWVQAAVAAVLVLVAIEFIGSLSALEGLTVRSHTSAPGSLWVFSDQKPEFDNAVRELGTRTLIDFEDIDVRPISDTITGRTPLDGLQYASRGMVLSNPNNVPLYVAPGGLIAFVLQADGTRVPRTWNPTSSLSVGRFPRDPLDHAIETPFIEDDDLVAAFEPGCSAAAFSVNDKGNYAPADNFIQLFDAQGELIQRTAFPRTFLGIVSPARRIIRISISEAANDGDDVTYDDFVCVR